MVSRNTYFDRSSVMGGYYPSLNGYLCSFRSGSDKQKLCCSRSVLMLFYGRNNGNVYQNTTVNDSHVMLNKLENISTETNASESLGFYLVHSHVLSRKHYTVFNRLCHFVINMIHLGST